MSRGYRQEGLWPCPCPCQNERVANSAVAVPVFAMEQITRLDRTEGEDYADTIGEYKLGFHAVDMGNVAVQLRPVPSSQVLRYSASISASPSYAGRLGILICHRPWSRMSSCDRSSLGKAKSTVPRKSAAVRLLLTAWNLRELTKVDWIQTL